MMYPAVEPLCDAHLAKKCLRLARGQRAQVDGVPQTFFFDAPSLLFESSVEKLGELGKGFVCFNCKDTHYLKVFVYVGKLIHESDRAAWRVVTLQLAMTSSQFL